MFEPVLMFGTDPLMSRVCQFVLSGWPNSVKDQTLPFKAQSGWLCSLIIPKAGQIAVLQNPPWCYGTALM